MGRRGGGGCGARIRRALLRLLYDDVRWLGVGASIELFDGGDEKKLKILFGRGVTDACKYSPLKRSEAGLSSFGHCLSAELVFAVLHDANQPTSHQAAARTCQPSPWPPSSLSFPPMTPASDPQGQRGADHNRKSVSICYRPEPIGVERANCGDDCVSEWCTTDSAASPECAYSRRGIGTFSAEGRATRLEGRLRGRY